MKKINVWITILILIGVCTGLFFGGNAFIHYLNRDFTSTIPAKSKGHPNAPLKIVEFIDFQCEPCALGSAYLDQFMKEFPGVVRLEIKYFPLGKHPHAMTSARYAECAARQGRFWPLHNLLLQRQEQWIHLDDVTDVFHRMARDVNLDRDVLDVCLEDKTVDALIKHDKKEGRSIEVLATPTFFVNERKVVGKANLERQLNRLIKNIQR